MTSFTTRTFIGSDGTEFELKYFSAALTGPGTECAKLARKGFGKTPAAMRLTIDDLGLLAMTAREAFMEAVGRDSLEVTPTDLQVGDAIEGLGEIEEVTRLEATGYLMGISVRLKDTGTSILFDLDEKGQFGQLIDITRATVESVEQ